MPIKHYLDLILINNHHLIILANQTLFGFDFNLQ